MCEERRGGQLTRGCGAGVGVLLWVIHLWTHVLHSTGDDHSNTWQLPVPTVSSYGSDPLHEMSCVRVAITITVWGAHVFRHQQKDPL